MENVKQVIPEEEPNRINLHTYWKVFWRKKFFLIVPLVLSAVIAVVGVKRLTPIYESHTMLTLEDKSILSPAIERYVPDAERRSQMQNQQYRAMIETEVRSNDFLRTMIEGLGLQRSEQVRRYVESYAPPKGAEGVPFDERVMRYLIGLFKEKIEVNSPMTGFYTISIYDTDPTTAYVLAERVTQTFLDVTRQDQIKGIRQAGAFSDEQLAIYKDKLDSSEKDLARVKREMADTEVQNNPVNAANVNYARALKQTVDADAERTAIALRRVRDRLVTILNTVPASEKITGDETVRNCENKIRAYGNEKLLHDLTVPQPPPMPPDQYNDNAAALRARIGELVESEYTNVPAEVHPLLVEYFYQRSLNEYNSLIGRKLQGYLDQYTRNYEMRPGLEREYNRLTQEVEANRSIYRNFLESKTSARISEAAQTTNIGLNLAIVERAEKPMEPVKPNKIKLMLLAVIFGGACGLAAIIVTEYIDDSFRSIEEVERVMKLPVLGTVPKMVAGFAWEKRQRGVMIVTWIVGVTLLVAMMSGALYVYAGKLKASGLGFELPVDQQTGEVQK